MIFVESPRCRASRLNIGSYRRLAVAALAFAVFFTAGAFAARLWFVATSGPYAATTGFEEFCIYNIWKAAHGFALYEWPQKEPFLLTSYNTGFYHVYAAWVRLWGATDGGLVLAARTFTLLWTLLAAVLQVQLVRRIVPQSSWSPGWAWTLAFLFWLGSTYSPWMPVTARPDTAAVAFSLGGLVLALTARQRDAAWQWVAASLCFFAAWSFKQSVVLIFAGVVLLEVVSLARCRRIVLLVLPFSILASVVICRAGEAYRYNVFVVPAIYRWFPGQSVVLLAKLAVLNLFFAVFGGLALLQALRRWRETQAAGTNDERNYLAIAVVAIPAVVFGALQLALHGSNVNNFIEGAALLVVLATAGWLKVWRRPDASASLLTGAFLLLTIIPVPLLHVVQAARGIPETEIRAVSLGNATKLNLAQLAQRKEFGRWMQTLPKPIWINDAMLQMPWFATDGKYPAYPFDFQFNADAMMKHVLEDRGFISLIRQRRFAALLLRPQHDAWFIRAAQAAGYVEAPVPSRFSPLATEYGLERVGPRLFLRPTATVTD